MGCPMYKEERDPHRRISSVNFHSRSADRHGSDMVCTSKCGQHVYRISSTPTYMLSHEVMLMAMTRLIGRFASANPSVNFMSYEKSTISCSGQVEIKFESITGAEGPNDTCFDRMCVENVVSELMLQWGSGRDRTLLGGAGSTRITSTLTEYSKAILENLFGSDKGSAYAMEAIDMLTFTTITPATR